MLWYQNDGGHISNDAFEELDGLNENEIDKHVAILRKRNRIIWKEHKEKN